MASSYEASSFRQKLSRVRPFLPYVGAGAALLAVVAVAAVAATYHVSGHGTTA